MESFIMIEPDDISVQVYPDTPNSNNTVGYVPAYELDPFYAWSVDPEFFAPTDASWLFEGGSTLLTGSGDLVSLVLQLIKQHIAKHNVKVPRERPVYIRGDFFPSASPFFAILQKYCGTPIRFCYKQDFQDFPANLGDSPYVDKVYFRWVVVNSEIPPWATDTFNRQSRLQNALEITKHNPSLLILDGFSWNGNKKDFHAMLQYLRKRKISLIVLNPTYPPKSLVGNNNWDNIIVANQWRKWRCAPSRMTVNILKKERTKVDFKYDLNLKDGEVVFNPQNTNAIRSVVASYMRAGKTAAQIVDLINNNETLAFMLRKKLTVSTLANLKRKWGLRTYKPESKPRKAKSKRQKAVSSLLEETM